MAETRIKHQLNIDLDWCGDDVFLSYGYHDSGVQIPQQRQNLSIHSIPREEVSTLEAIACAALRSFTASRFLARPR